MKLEATALKVTLARKSIIKGVDFIAKAGQVTAIVGPNGSGKTTLLRAMIGEIPSEGNVLLNGRSIVDIPPPELAAMRGVLPQSTPLAFPFSVAEIVHLGLTSGTSGGKAQIIAEALASVGLTSYAPRLYQELSGGEQQRVQLARVLAQVWDPVYKGAPRWLFLDEPVASLDIGHQLQIMDIAQHYAARGGGVIAVMHDLNLTAAYADQITLMSNGSVLANGPPGSVLQDSILTSAYGCKIQVNTPPRTDMPFILPQACL